jgi:peptidoglycan/LPS O-acetylase OafA/YrhL
MPEPVGRSERYMPGLDGLRAVAVLAVVAFHLGFEWAPGGLLGVGVFFTLSGYLITDILLRQLSRRSRIELLSFWGARARRLLPALFLMLVVVVAWVTLFGPPQSPKFRESVLPAIFYVSNWWLIFEQVSYFADFAPPAPFNHLWSLAVEEQFYIVWPFLLLAGTLLVRETPLPSGIRPRLAVLTAGLAVVSAIAMAVLYEPSLDPSRVYYGTDTRAAELLVGAALAMIWPSRKLKRAVAPRARRLLDGMGVAGLLAILLMVWQTSQYDSFLYRGGFLLLALATALLVAAIAHPACRIGAVLGWEPLRWIGVRSYGIYLWHFPIIVLTTPSGAEQGNDLLRDLLQGAAILLVAALSWRFVEEPIRRGALGRLWRAARSGALRPRAAPRAAWAAVAGGALVFLVAIAGMAGAGPGEASEADVPGAGGEESRTARAKAPREAALPGQSSCRAVIHIGDSTSEGLTSDSYLPSPGDRIDAQYARVGAKVQQIEISGARSIVETFEGQPNAEEVARAYRAEGFDGCWVLALGTNDSANVFVSDRTDERERIDLMMRAIGEQPVLWVNVKSVVESGPYAAENMRAWDEALLAACPSYPSMRVFDWASAVRDRWFIDDGIHFTTPGYRARSRTIADALAEAFPGGGTPPKGCLIEPPPPPRPPRRSAAR